MSEPDAPSVTVMDDGELLLVREMLSEAGIAAGDGMKTRAEGPPKPAALLITTPRHALSQTRPPARLHLVVYDEVSKTLRKALERSGCDIALQSPLDAAMLHLLVERALYRGPERRRRRRAVIAAPVKIKSGLRQSEVTLGQLSARGCGLVLDNTMSLGKKLKITLPESLCDGALLKLEGTVISCQPIPNKHGGHEASVRFEKLAPADQRKLDAVVSRHALPERTAASPGAPSLEAEAATATRDGNPETGSATMERAATAGTGADRRKQPRKLFKSQLLATGAGASHLLFGCDLSTGGMRIRHDPALEVGDRLKLALYTRKGLPSVMLQAVVAHEDTDGTIGLKFQNVPEKLAHNLDQIVDTLPLLPPSQDGGPGVIVSQVLEHTEPEEGE